MTKATSGWINGFLGVLVFSGSLPATRVALAGFDPIFLTVMRAIIAAALALSLLLVLKEQRPQRAEAAALIVTALGVVVGFPLLTALALHHMNAAHSVVFTGMLPLVTSIFGVLRGGERPKALFWIFAGLGSLCVACFALTSATRSTPMSDILMLLAILLCGLGYAEGAVLARRLGGWQVICWALVVSLPFMLSSLPFLSFPNYGMLSWSAWAGLAYVSVFSMLIGFVFWYRGLAQGGIAAVSQLQFLQPLFGLAIAGMLLHEPIERAMIITALGVLICVFGAKKFA